MPFNKSLHKIKNSWLIQTVSYHLTGTVLGRTHLHSLRNGILSRVHSIIWNVLHLRLVELPFGGERLQRVLQPKDLAAQLRPGEENAFNEKLKLEKN